MQLLMAEPDIRQSNTHVPGLPEWHTSMASKFWRWG